MGAAMYAAGQAEGPTADAPEDEADADGDVVVVCHHGGRSVSAAMVLERAGLRASNLAGGIDAWSRDVDPSVPTY
jgi:rhodanese-related sulfurtransferase